MIRAALKYILDGRTQFETIPDPFGSGPFEVYVPREGAFELKSKLMGSNAPIALMFGDPSPR